MSTGSIDQIIDSLFTPISTAISQVVFFSVPVLDAELPLIVVWLMAGAVFLTFWLRFQPIRGMRHSFAIIRGRFTRKTDPGVISSFQALATELSGTVGLGNIAGVAVAISLGGPGAALWIIIFGFFAMSLKMAEATLGVKYRTINADGSTSGGPMYYLRDGLKQIGFGRLGAFLAVLYSIFTLGGTIGVGNLFQANQAAAAISGQLDPGGWLDQNRWVVGIGLAVLVGVVILGGIGSIARWTSRITPAMALLYFLCALTIIVVHITELPQAVVSIVVGAVTAEGVTGGAVGAFIIGMQRALFSNAAGVGTAGMAHSAVKTRDPATEGYVAMWEPFIDSVVICTLTALAVTVTGVAAGGVEEGSTAEGIALTAQAFATVAPWFPVPLTICAVLFGFSTILSYAYYAELASVHLFGEHRGVRIGARIVWVLATALGAAISLSSVIDFADSMFFLMTVPNLLGIYLLARVLRLEILRHKKRVDTGMIAVVPPELRVGMRNDHEPTAEQRASERERLERLDTRALEIRRALDGRAASADDGLRPHREG